MHQTEYKTLQAITKSNSSLSAGICKWWYTPIDNIALFPSINPVTQMLSFQPTLKAGAVWYGPIDIPRKRAGWKQQQDQSKPGKFYKHAIEAFNGGIDAAGVINLDNLSHYQLCIIAKLRSGGNFIVLGNNVTGCELDDEINTGIAMGDTPGTKLVFSWESIDKALTLSIFIP